MRKLGAVAYLNAKPLLQGVEARLGTPAELAAWLRAGEVDGALVPVAEAIENPEYWLVDGVCIGCDGPVYSVFLVLEKPLAEVRTVRLDEASRTSARLTRWLLERHYGLAVRYVGEGEAADARLLIGDPAIAYRHAHPGVVLLDLGEAWKAATGLPFVFATWALRQPDVELAAQLRQAAAAGLAGREALVREPWQREYLTRYIRYELGAEERSGLARFAGVLDAAWAPRWI